MQPSPDHHDRHDRRRPAGRDPRFLVPEPPRPPHRPAGGLRAERRRPRGRRRLFVEARALHADTTERLRTIDGAIEALVDQRLACLDVLVDCRDQLRPSWGTQHSRRRASVDEAPFPEAPPAAQPVEGVSLRSIAVTILRRHGPQRLRDLHGLLHLYGYCIAGVRPVQRLGDAMAYEVRRGRAERLERGVYGPAEPHPGPGRYPSPPIGLGPTLTWERPITDPGPPHLDPEVADDPELWSDGEWPTEHDLPPDVPVEGEAPAGGSDAGAAVGDAERATDPGADTSAGDGDAPAAPADPPGGVGDDSPTNRRPEPPAQPWRWAPPP